MNDDNNAGSLNESTQGIEEVDIEAVEEVLGGAAPLVLRDVAARLNVRDIVAVLNDRARLVPRLVRAEEVDWH
jgi:hypothetical protein